MVQVEIQIRSWGNNFIEKLAQGFIHTAGRVDGSNHHAVTVNSGKVQLIPGPLCQLAEIKPLGSSVTLPKCTYTMSLSLAVLGVDLVQAVP